MQFITLDVISRSLGEVGSTILYIAVATVVLELIVYFLWEPLGRFSQAVDRALKFLGDPIRHAISTLLWIGVMIFAVGAIGVGEQQSPIAAYWPLAVVAVPVSYTHLRAHETT